MKSQSAFAAKPKSCKGRITAFKTRGMDERLAAKGLIKRQPDPADGRRRTIILTADGTALADTIAAEAASGQDDFLGALDDHDREHLNDLLQRLYNAHVHKS